MQGKTFIDSNILIYAFDDSDERKRKMANQVLSDLWSQDAGTLSVQVLQEFYTNVTRKIRNPIAKPTAHRVVNHYSKWCGATTAHEVQAAFRIESAALISFWDALIVACAQNNGATRILSEDMQHGQVIAGIAIVNPFR